MPTVGIDCRFGSARAGLGTYTRSIVHALTRRNDPWSLVLFVGSLEEAWLQDVRRDGVTMIESTIPHYSLAEQFRFPRLIARSGCDLFYAPHFNVPFRCPVPFVTTIHDLILHRFPGEASLTKRIGYRFTIGQAVRRSKRIITVSTFTAGELADVYGSSVSGRTTVIHPGVTPLFSPRSLCEQEKVREKYSLTKPFLLYVGGTKQHKNVPMLIDAFNRAALSDMDLVLVTGRAADINGGGNVRILDAVTDDNLARLFSSALGSVTATLAEGFYLPAIEAMACGCPVLATDVGAIPETTGGHAILVDPAPDSLTSGIRALSKDQSIRTPEQHAARIGYAKSFSWERTAAEAAQVFEKELRM